MLELTSKKTQYPQSYSYTKRALKSSLPTHTNTHTPSPTRLWSDLLTHPAGHVRTHTHTLYSSRLCRQGCSPSLCWQISVLGRISNPSWLSICHCRWVVALSLIPSHFHSYLSVFMDSSCVSSQRITALLSGWQNCPQSATNDSLSLWLLAGGNAVTPPRLPCLSLALAWFSISSCRQSSLMMGSDRTSFLWSLKIIRKKGQG